MYNSVWFLVPLLFLLFPAQVHAEPARPQYGINEVTKECARFFMGDECADCRLPDEWLGIEGHNCPIGYTEVEHDSICTQRKTSFCCTLYHTGTSGDCKDVVVNEIEKKCAFVEDIHSCKNLPPGWQMPEEDEDWGRLCPSHEYNWPVDYLSCTTTTNLFPRQLTKFITTLISLALALIRS